MMGSDLYGWWKFHVEDKIVRLTKTITEYQREGYYTVGCGAAAKGISMLNMAGLKLDIIADTTPTKWGKIASGMKIVPFDEIAKLAQGKVLFVILAWNLRSEVKRSVLALRDNPSDVFIE